MTLRKKLGSGQPNFFVEDESLLKYWYEKQQSHAERSSKPNTTSHRIDNHAHYVHKKIKKQLTGNEIVLEILREFDLDHLFKHIRNCYLGMKLTDKAGNNRTLLHTIASFTQDLTPSTAMVEAIFLSKLALKAGVDVNAQDVQGNTALHLVVNNTDHTYLCFLLRCGADPFIVNEDKKAPIDIARTYCTGKEDESAGGLLIKCHNNLFLTKPRLEMLRETRRFSLSIAFILANLASLVYKRKQAVSTSDIYVVPESLYSSTTAFIRRPHWNNIIAHSIAKRWGFETVLVVDDVARCLICKYKNIWVISFKGTDKIEDILADLNVISMEEDKYVGGIYKLLIRIWPQIASVVPKYSREIQDTIVYCTGHSMGGALATMCADFLISKENYPTKNVILYSFASPRCGSVELRNSIAALNHAYAIVRCGDPIPHLPMQALFSASNCGSVRYLDENGKLFNDPHYKFHDIAREMNRVTTNMLDHCTMWISGLSKFREDDIPIGCFPEHKRALVCKIIDTIRNPTEVIQTVKKPHDMLGYQTDIFNLHKLVTTPMIDKTKDLITAQNLQKIDVPEGYLDRYTSERMYVEREEALDNWARNYAKTSKVEPFTFTDDTETGVIVNWFESEMDVLIKLDQLEQTIRTNPKFENPPNFTIPLLPIQKVKISPYVQCKLLRILQLIYYSIHSYSMSKQLFYALIRELPGGWVIEPKLIVENNLLVPEYIELPNLPVKVQQIKILEKSVNYSKTILFLADHLVNEIEKQAKESMKSPRETNQTDGAGGLEANKSADGGATPRRKREDEKMYRKKFYIKLKHFRTTSSTGFRFESSKVRSTIKTIVYKPENYQEKFNEIKDKEKLEELKSLGEFVIIFYSNKIYKVENPEMLAFFSKFKSTEILETLDASNSAFELRIQGKKFKVLLNYKNTTMETALNYLSFKLVKNLHLFKFQGFFKKEEKLFPFLLIAEEENQSSLENYLSINYFDEENSIAQYSRLFLLNLALILTGEISDFATFDNKGKKKFLNTRELISEMNQKYPVNILFCLNEIHLPVHKNILNDFKELNLKLIIEKWGKHLRESDSLLHSFSNYFHAPEFFSLANFNEIWLVNFTNRIYNIQKFWAKRKNPTHLDTLLHIYPEQKELFQSIFYEIRNPINRYYLLKNRFTREFHLNNAPTPGECAALYTTRKMNTSRTNLVAARSQSSSSSSEYLEKSTSGSSTSQSTPKTIVNYIFDGGGLEIIERCKSMLLDFVKKTSSSSSQEILTFKRSFLTEFEKLRDSSIVEMFLETIQLELAPLKDPDTRRTLQTFILDGLVDRKYELGIVNLNNFDYMDNCALDKIFRLNSKTLTTVSIRDCSRLTQIGVSGWFKNVTHLPNLEKLDISGCNIDDCSKFFIDPNPNAKIITTSRLRVKKNSPERVFTQILPCLCRANANIYCSDDLDKNSVQQIQNLIAAGLCPSSVLNKQFF